MARVAVVEDDASIRSFLGALLARKGHEPVVFPDGAAALPAIERGGFDLVISDVQMPQLDGISLCRLLRERFSKDVLPVILVSVLDQEDDVVRALEAGANDYLVKPFPLAVLRAKLGFHLRQEGAPPTPGPRRADVLEERPRLPCAFDAYELRGVLGRGGHGDVYRARRTGDGRPVAVKLLSRELERDRPMLARYFREVALLAEVRSPHVVPFVASGYEQGRFFLVMDVVEGRPASDVLDEDGPFAVGPALRVGRGMARAIAALARRGLVHRDVKPSNVLVRPDGEAVLIDFGLAKRPGEQVLTRADEILGTPEYLAPEVIRGDPEHPGSDLYALGVSLWELLTGTLPFHADTDYELLAAIAEGPAARPARALRPEVPAAVSDLVARLMDPEPEQRLADPAQAVAELDAHLARWG